jgi:hypothetical protein
MMSVESTCSRFNRTLLSKYILNGTIYPGTLLGRVINAGYSPVDILFESGEGSRRVSTVTPTDGIVDSLPFLLHSPGYNKGEIERTLTRLLLKSF